MALEWMIAISIFAVFIMVIFIAAYHEANRVKISRVEIKNKKVSGEIDILQVSDLHLFKGVNLKRKNAIIKAIEEAIADKVPDMVFLTGDFMDHENGAEHLREILSRLKSKYGIFAVLGNHDYLVYNFLHVLKPFFSWTDSRPADVEGLMKLLTEFGIEVLIDEKREISVNKMKMSIYGAGFQTIKKRCTGNLQIVQGDSLNILLSHYPDAVLYYKNLADIVISGHTHGGQFSLFGLPVITSCRIKFGRAKGLSKWGNTSLFVSKGIGSSRFFPFRFFADPEINRIIIKGE